MKAEESNSDYFIRKALEGIEAKVNSFDEKLKEIDGVLSSHIFSGLQSLNFQVETIVRLLIKKEIVDQKEFEELVEEVYREIQSIIQAKQDETQTPNDSTNLSLNSAG